MAVHPSTGSARPSSPCGEVLRVVAHDLRNPLTSIFAHSDLLLEALPEGRLDPRERRWLETIRRAAEQMERLVGDLRDVSAGEDGRLSLAPAACAAGDLCDEAAALFAPLAARRQVRLEAGADPGLPAVSADRDRVLQVLSNLLANAVDFTPAGGTVAVRAQRDAAGVRFSVRDEGCGIDAESLPRVFEPFWRTRTVGRSGMGLGLSIARGIVEGHGGRIWAESVPGEGSTFHFTLPLAAAERPARRVGCG